MTRERESDERERGERSRKDGRGKRINKKRDLGEDVVCCAVHDAADLGNAVAEVVVLFHEPSKQVSLLSRRRSDIARHNDVTTTRKIEELEINKTSADEASEDRAIGLNEGGRRGGAGGSLERVDDGDAAAHRRLETQPRRRVRPVQESRGLVLCSSALTGNWNRP
jgi:hypothetical protein